MNSLSQLNLRIVFTQSQTALELSLKHLPDELTRPGIVCLNAPPENTHGCAVFQISPSDNLSLLYQAILPTSAGPCLILHAGEVLDSKAWATIADLMEAEDSLPVHTAKIALPGITLTAPRLWLSAQALTGSVFPQIEHPPAPQFEIVSVAAEHVEMLKGTEAEILESLSAEGLKSSDLIFAEGMLAFQTLRDQEARDIFAQLTLQEPTSFWHQAARVMWLKTCWEMHEYELVFEQLEHFRQFNGIEQIPGLWVLRGVMARAKDEKELAMDCYHQALALVEKPDFYQNNPYILQPDITWKPVLGLAEIQFQEGLYSLAFLNYQKASLDLVQHPVVLAGLLKSAFFIQRFDTVREILNSATEIAISEVSQQALKALCALELDAASQSIEIAEFETALKSSEQDAFFYSVILELAIALLRTTQYASAQILLSYLAELIPNQPAIGHNLAYSYFAEKKYAEAEEMYRKVLLQSPRFFESRFDLAKTLVMQNQSDEAILELEKILQENPRFSKARQALAELKQRDLEAYILPSRSDSDAAQAPDAVKESPFVFVFPLATSWENGIDLLLKAYYQAFIPEDNVILALPAGSDSEALQAAQAWAKEAFEPEFLPPLALIEAPIPLIPDSSAWVIPWRVPPHEEVIQALKTSAYPALVTGRVLNVSGEPIWPLELVQDQTAQKIWIEADLKALANLMRQVYEGQIKGTTEPSKQEATHDFLRLKQASASPEYKPEVMTPQSEKQTLSVCMIVRDEAKNLARCLDSCAAECDEIIVVDTGSQDQTLEIAQAYDKVQTFSFPWQDDFSAARNFALEQAQSDWVLVLDADEYLPKDFLSKIRYYLGLAQQPDAYAFPVQAIDESGELVPELSLGAVPRLFRNAPEYRYRGLIHEMVYHRDRDKMSYYLMKHLPIFHVGYQVAVRQDKQKYQRDTVLMHTMINTFPNNPETARIHNILASVYEENAEYAQALEHYQLGLERVQNDPMIREVLHRGKFRTLLHMNAYEQIILELGPDNESNDPYLCLYLAEAYFQQGQAENALDQAKHALHNQLTQALEPDPLGQQLPRQEIYFLLARLSTKLNRYEQAAYYFKHYLKLCPTDASAKREYEALEKH